jgi:hypothetical protein
VDNPSLRLFATRMRVGLHYRGRASKRTSFIAFLAYCLQITLTRRLHSLAPGLTALRTWQLDAARDARLERF